MRFVIYFCLDYFSISWCLCLLISSQSSMEGEFIILLCTNTNWPGVACNLVWYVLRNMKARLLEHLTRDHPCICSYFKSITYIQGLLWLGEFVLISNLIGDFYICTLGFYTVFVFDFFLNPRTNISSPQSYVITLGLGYLHKHVWFTRFVIISDCW